MDKLPTHTCLNCGSEASDNFCSNCGQSTRTSRVTFRQTFANLLGTYFSFEGKLWETIVSMATQPGVVIKSYLSGKRQKFYKPTAFFVLLTALYLIVRAILDYDPLKGQFDELDLSNPDSFQVKSQLAARYMIQHINNILFIMVIAIGLVWKLFYWTKYNLAEFVTIGFYVTGFYIGLGHITMLVSHFADINLSNIQLALLTLYFTFVQGSTFGFGPWYKWIYYLLVSGVTILLYTNLGFGLAYWIVN